MKQNSTRRQNPKRGGTKHQGVVTIGMDLGDKTRRYCVLDHQGEVVKEGSVATTKKGMAQTFSAFNLNPEVRS
jgi:hypothetical protein